MTKLTLALEERIQTKFIELYGDDVGRLYAAKLVERLNAGLSVPPRSLTLNEQAVVAIAYGDHAQQPPATPLTGLHEFLNRHLSDLISAVHILPFYPFTSDDGFSVSDYRAVDPRLGTWADVRALGDDFGLMFDLVLNHTSVASDWFQRMLKGEDAYRDYYVTADPTLDLSGVVRPRTHPLLTAFATPNGERHVWTTFSTDQVDLNFANPVVLMEMLETLLFYVEQGADLIRLDAIAYLWKTVGTTCIHLSQTHRVVQLFRDVLDAVAPWVVLITETNVPHTENIAYFGSGTDEAQMVYNFALPPLLVHTLQTGSADVLTTWAATLHAPSPQTTFFNFTASHDGIGVRPATGLLSDAQIAAMVARIQQHGGQISYKSNTDGSQSAYEMNCTYFDALSSPDDPRAVDRFIVSQAIMLSLAGVPGIYLPSLFGARNWHAGAAETGRARTINREKYALDQLDRRLTTPSTTEYQVFSRYAELLRVRRSQAAFHPNSPQRILTLDDGLFAVERGSAADGSRLLCLHNVTDRALSAALPRGQWHTLYPASSQAVSGTCVIDPYQCVWLRADA